MSLSTMPIVKHAWLMVATNFGKKNISQASDESVIAVVVRNACVFIRMLRTNPKL